MSKILEKLFQLSRFQKLQKTWCLEKESRWSIGYNECHEKDLFENETKRRNNVQLIIQLVIGNQPEIRNVQM